jgi:hypothetical protein
VTRRSELEAIRQSILTEIYRMSLELGMDPDTLDTDSFAHDEIELGERNDFNTHCRKLQIVEKKLREIQ